MISDIACKATKADCAIINSGTLRSDVVHDPGVFKLKVSNRYHMYGYVYKSRLNMHIYIYAILCTISCVVNLIMMMIKLVSNLITFALNVWIAHTYT